VNRPSRRGRRTAPGIVTIYWRDIPAQITVSTADGETEKILLDPRFQHAIDRAAHIAGLTATHDYIEQWRRVPAPVDDEADAAARATADAIHAEYPRERLEALVASGGLEAEPPGGPRP
jgi:hypothetical protein